MKQYKVLTTILIVIIFVLLAYTYGVRIYTRRQQNVIQDVVADIFTSSVTLDEEIPDINNADVSSELEKLDEIEVVDEIDEERITREKFQALQEEFNNEDIVGYLRINGTTIDYPVVQYSDNQYYLNHDLYKNKSYTGSIYLDFENNLSGDDYNTVIYGHNYREDIMFHSLRYYKTKSFYDEHKYIEYSTLFEDYIFEIFSVYETAVDFPYITVLFQDENSFYDLSRQFKEKSIYDTGVELTKEDKVITLSTCTSSPIDGDRRLVIHGKLIPKENN